MVCTWLNHPSMKAVVMSRLREWLDKPVSEIALGLVGIAINSLLVAVTFSLGALSSADWAEYWIIFLAAITIGSLGLIVRGVTRMGKRTPSDLERLTVALENLVEEMQKDRETKDA